MDLEFDFWQKRSDEVRDISTPPSEGVEVLYRCDISVYEHGPNIINFEAYPITKYTNYGVWIDVYGRSKFVLLTAIKQWACRTKEEALISFIARKESQLKIFKRQTEYAERQLSLAKGFKL